MTSQRALIVGGSSGIGLATARLLSKQGLRAIIAGRSVDKLAAAQTALGDAVETAMLDAADLASLPKAVASLGAFDHLVLAFGSSKGVGPFASIGIGDVRQGFEEKVFPQFLCAQATLPQLSEAGSITFISAVSAYAAMPGTAGIGSANAAIAALVPTLAAELRPLRINAVCPGVIDTPWWDFLPNEQKAAVFSELAGKTPVGRVGKPDDVAQAIAFLISNTFMTGQTIVCDGGLSLGG